MQCNTMVIDSISKDFSSHLYWLFKKFREKEKKKKKKLYFKLCSVLSKMI